MQRDKGWMYNKNLPERRGLTDEFRIGLKLFLNFASSKYEFMDRNKLRCLCKSAVMKNFKTLIKLENIFVDLGLL